MVYIQSLDFKPHLAFAASQAGIICMRPSQNLAAETGPRMHVSCEGAVTFGAGTGVHSGPPSIRCKFHPVKCL